MPEKYRFLLFDDKREVELVWNGKTGEVCNLVLPFQTIEQVDEPCAEKPEDTSAQFGLFAERGCQLMSCKNRETEVLETTVRLSITFEDEDQDAQSLLLVALVV